MNTLRTINPKIPQKSLDGMNLNLYMAADISIKEECSKKWPTDSNTEEKPIIGNKYSNFLGHTVTKPHLANGKKSQFQS